VASLLVFRLWFYNSFGFRSERSDEGRSGGAGPAILGSPRWASTPAPTTACFAGDFQADDQQANDLQAENADDDWTVTAGPWDRNRMRPSRSQPRDQLRFHLRRRFLARGARTAISYNQLQTRRKCQTHQLRGVIRLFNFRAAV